MFAKMPSMELNRITTPAAMYQGSRHDSEKKQLWNVGKKKRMEEVLEWSSVFIVKLKEKDIATVRLN